MSRVLKSLFSPWRYPRFVNGVATGFFLSASYSSAAWGLGLSATAGISVLVRLGLGAALVSWRMKPPAGKSTAVYSEWTFDPSRLVREDGGPMGGGKWDNVVRSTTIAVVKR